MNESSIENSKDEYINKEDLEKELESCEAEYNNQKRVVGYLSHPSEAEEDDIEGPTENQSPYDAEIEKFEIKEQKYYEKTDAFSKIEQSEKFYDKYWSPGKQGYTNIIHKQGKNVEDKLDKKKDAKKIADLIVKDKVKTVGIFGEWGTGKSSFLELIKEELHKESKIKVVDLKATEYSDRDKIWTYFCAEMEKAALKEEKLKKFWNIVKPYFIGFVKMLLVFVLYFVFLTGAVAALKYFKLLEVMALLSGIKADDYNNFTRGMFVLVGIVFVFKNMIPILENTFDLYGTWNEHSKKYKINCYYSHFPRYGIFHIKSLRPYKNAKKPEKIKLFRHFLLQ